jgi:type I restriction enzyme, S subunit
MSLVFEEIPFVDLLSNIVDNRGRTCPTSPHGLPLIATNCIREEQLYPTFEKVRHVSPETYRDWFRGHPAPGDIIFVCKGSPGRVALTPDPVSFCIAQDMVAVRADDKKVSPRYLFAALRTRLVQQRVRSMHVGTLIPHFKKGDFQNLLIPVPGPAEQKAIGDSYFHLSAKLESCRRQVRLIGELVPSLFQMLTKDSREFEAFGDLIDCTKGASYRTADLVPSDTALVTLKSFDRTGGYKPSGLKSFSGRFKPEQEIEPRELVVAQTDLTQAAEVVGRTVRVPAQRGVKHLVASLDVLIVRPRAGVPVEFVYAAMLEPEFREHCKGHASGTTVLHLASDAFPSYRVPAVTPSRREEFAASLRPLLDRHDALGREMQALEELRDALLHGWFTGQVDPLHTTTVALETVR